MKLRFCKSFAGLIKLLIKDCDNEIAKTIKGLMGKDNKDLDINWLQLSDREGCVCYKSDKKITLKIREIYKNHKVESIEENIINEDVRGNVRDEVNIVHVRTGRLIQKVLSLSEKKFSNAEVEAFVNKFVAYQKSMTAIDFVLLTGNDIKKAYTRSNYTLTRGTSNDLHGSCMVDMFDYLDIYTKNKNISALALYSGDGKIFGRCILWTAELNGKEIKIMDRVYTVKDSDDQIFRKWGKDNGYVCRKISNNCSCESAKNFIDVDGVSDIDISGAVVKLDRSKFENYPYMDSFFALDRKNNELRNSISNDQYKNGILELRSTGGDFSGHDDYCLVETVDGDEVEGALCYNSNYHGGFILRDGAIKVYYNSNTEECDYIIEDQVKVGHKKKTKREVVFSEKDNKNYFKSLAIYSDRYESWVSRSDVYFSQTVNDYILLAEKDNIEGDSSFIVITKNSKLELDIDKHYNISFLKDGVSNMGILAHSPDQKKWYIFSNCLQGSEPRDIKPKKFGFRYGWLFSRNGVDVSDMIESDGGQFNILL